MICTYFKEGQKLNVADLNEITVLIDRSKTELTEVAFNEWRAELTGPPHQHSQKEQMFFIVCGEGPITIGDETFEAKPDVLFYVPTGVPHQTIVTTDEPLGYILFNAFSNSDKEGHATFADHIAEVKATRRKQADTQKADVAGTEAASDKKGKCFSDIYSGKRYDFDSSSAVLLLDRAESERCETTVVSCPAGNKGLAASHKDREHTLYVLSGTGSVTIGDETEPVKQGTVVFVPRNTAHSVEAGKEQLTYLCLSTVVDQDKYSSFEEMYNDTSK